MNLGAFSLSLCVDNLTRSREFYEKLGFKVMGGDAEQGWQILKSPTCTLGLFEKYIQKNTLTFNPGWDSDAQALADYTDVRDVQKALKKAGLELTREADASTTGPEHIVLMDPDGNPILIDQHI